VLLAFGCCAHPVVVSLRFDCGFRQSLPRDHQASVTLCQLLKIVSIKRQEELALNHSAMPCVYGPLSLVSHVFLLAY
jgi:hypothetical protein